MQHLQKVIRLMDETRTPEVRRLRRSGLGSGRGGTSRMRIELWKRTPQDAIRHHHLVQLVRSLWIQQSSRAPTSLHGRP